MLEADGDREEEKVTWAVSLDPVCGGTDLPCVQIHSIVPQERGLYHSKRLSWVLLVTPQVLGATGPFFVFWLDVNSAFPFPQNSLAFQMWL